MNDMPEILMKDFDPTMTPEEQARWDKYSPTIMGAKAHLSGYNGNRTREIKIFLYNELLKGPEARRSLVTYISGALHFANKLPLRTVGETKRECYVCAFGERYRRPSEPVRSEVRSTDF